MIEIQYKEYGAIAVLIGLVWVYYRLSPFMHEAVWLCSFLIACIVIWLKEKLDKEGVKE